jgi:hypothetical protein
MRKLSGLVLLTILAGAVVWGQAAQSVITSITVCSAAGSGGTGSCPAGSFDTQQLVVGSNGNSINSANGFGVVPDEHSSVFAPGMLVTNQDYLFFLASGSPGHADIGLTVLSGGAGPGKTGQWTLNIPAADGYGAYSTGFGPVFETAMSGTVCPTVADGNPAHGVALSLSPSTITAGSTSTVAVTVKPLSGSGTPTGTAGLVLGTGQTIATQTLSSGGAVSVIGNWPLGSYTVTAKYSGDGNFAPSQSDPITVTVTQPMLQPSITSVTPNVVKAGQATTITITGKNFASGLVACVEFDGACYKMQPTVTATKVIFTVTMPAGNYASAVVIENSSTLWTSAPFEVTN